MKFHKIDIQLPKPVKDIYDIVHSIEKNSCIAGGCIGDLYMGREFKDVDIFIRGFKKNYVEKKEVIKSISEAIRRLPIEECGLATDDDPFSVDNLFDDDFDDDSDIDSDHDAWKVVTQSEEDGEFLAYNSFKIFSFKYCGIKFQLIFNTNGIKCVKYFDFRFREFFYWKNSGFASTEALSDIHDQKLVFGVTRTPLKSLFRAFMFVDRYNFRIELRSLINLLHLIDIHNINSYNAISLLKKYRIRNNTSLLMFHKIVKLLKLDIFLYEKKITDVSDTEYFKQKHSIISLPFRNNSKNTIFKYFHEMDVDRESSKNMTLTYLKKQNSGERIILHKFLFNPFEEHAKSIAKRIVKNYESLQLMLMFEMDSATYTKFDKEMSNLDIHSSDFDFLYRTIIKFNEQRKKDHSLEALDVDLRQMKNEMALASKFIPVNEYIVTEKLSIDSLRYVNQKEYLTGTYCEIRDKNHPYLWAFVDVANKEVKSSKIYAPLLQYMRTEHFLKCL